MLFSDFICNIFDTYYFKPIAFVFVKPYIKTMFDSNSQWKTGKKVWQKLQTQLNETNAKKRQTAVFSKCCEVLDDYH